MKKQFIVLYMLLVFITGAKAQNIQYLPLYTDATFTRSLNMTSGAPNAGNSVGFTSGVLDVSPTGSVNYTIPIALPPGTQGIAPTIAISYNSQGGNGMMGMGWNFSSVSAISRVNKDIFNDGVVNSVKLNNTDLFALDGNKLTSLTGTYGSDGTTYATKMESFSTITSNGSINGGPAWFKVSAKNGMTYEYGNTPDSKFTLFTYPGPIAVATGMWYLNKAYDQYGNYIKYNYTRIDDEIKLSEIIYTGNDNAGIVPYNKIAFNYAFRDDKNLVFVYDAFVESKSILTDIVIATDNTQLVKKYNFKYGFDNIHSYLQEVIETGSDNTQLNSTIFKYGNLPPANQQGTVVNSSAFVGEIISKGDFNGDGLTDIVTGTKGMINNVSLFNAFNVYIKNTNNNDFTLTKHEDIASGFLVVTPTSYFSTVSNTLVSDVDADGRDDIIVVTLRNAGSLNLLSGDLKVYYPNATATSFTPVVRGLNYLDNTRPELSRCTISPKNNIFSGDFNGDGKIEFISLLGGCTGSTGVSLTAPFKAFLFSSDLANTTLANLPKEITFTTTQMNDILNAADVRVIDFDGDGKSELMTLTPGGHTVYSFTTNTSGTVNVNQLNDIANAIPNSSQPVILGDFNGDRKTDVLTKNSTGTWFINYSTGRWFRPWSDVITSSEFLLGDPIVDDFDGNGMSDVAYVSLGVNFTSNMNIQFSKGNSFYKKIIVNNSQGGLTNTGDFNGDGKADMISITQIFYFNKDSKNQLLEKITNGFNVTTSVNYKSMTEGGSFYTKGTTNTYPLNSIQMPLYLASSVVNFDGIGGINTTTYQYEDAIIHRAGKGFMGFRKFRSSNIIQDVETTSEFKILTPQYVTALEKTTIKQISTGTIISQATNTHSIKLNGNRYWLKTDETFTTDMTGGFTVKNYYYDDYGNITTEYTNINHEEYMYVYKGFEALGSLPPNLVAWTHTHKRRGGVSEWFQKIMSFSYNTKGDPVWAYDKDLNGSIWTTTYETYNIYHPNTGVLISSRLSSPESSNLPSKTTSFEYDTKHRYVTKTTNPLLQSATKTYNPRWGTVATETDIAGLTTTYTYDGFGRLINTLTPQGHNIGVQYLWSYNGLYLPVKCYDIVTTIPGKPSTWDIYDVFGRKTVATTENYGDADHRLVYTYQVTEYDARGNVFKTMTPVNATDWGTQEYTTYNYDGLNRLTTTVNSIGTTTYGYTYNAGKTTSSITTPPSVTFPTGQTSSKTTDASGMVISTTDYGGTLTFDYDSRGNQTAVKLGTTILSSMTYDFRGRQTSLTDKNAGTTSYNYNAYGELTWQQDAKGVQNTMEYDILGRVKKRTGLGELPTIYDYVLSGNGINQIDKITGINGVIEQQFTYDSWQRLTQAKETIDGTLYIKSFTYRMFNNKPTGDIQTTTYPSGLVITNSYSDDGYLFKVAAGSQVLFDGSDFAGGKMNGFGKWQNYRLGNGITPSGIINGITTSITYNTWGMPTLFKTGNIQDLDLDWDLKTGNLNFRWDKIKAKIENFTYDNLNRLTSAAIGVAAPTVFNYAANGNINSKTGVGTYVYDANKINAIAEVTHMTTPSVIPSFQQDITYTKFLRPEKLTEVTAAGTYELNYTYASDYERRKSVLKVNTTVVNTRLYMGDYEIDTKYGVSREIHYIAGGDGMCAIVVKESGVFNYYFPYLDHLGSILTVTDKFGVVVAEQNFDAWGRKRNVNTWDYAGVQSVPDWLYRGYTGHEHLSEFGLINMNARLYDPVLGRMLSPDNLVSEGGTQAFNRYSYANNNPLKFIDPSGDFPIIIVAAALIGGGLNLWNNWDKVKEGGFVTGLNYFGIGAVGGVASLTNPGAAVALVAAGNTLVDAVNPNFNLPDKPVDLLLYGGKKILDGLGVSGSGQLAKGIVSTFRQWTYRGYVETISAKELALRKAEGIIPSINQAGGQAAHLTVSSNVETIVSQKAINMYRSVSLKEYQDIVKHGFRPGDGYLTGKLFTANLQDAKFFSQAFENPVIVKLQVPGGIPIEKIYGVDGLKYIYNISSEHLKSLKFLTLFR